MTVRWSVSVQAEGDRTITHDEVLRLADAVAVHHGVASGIGTPGYGAQIVVAADSQPEALQRGRAVFADVVEQARLPEYPIVAVDALSEDADADPDILP